MANLFADLPETLSQESLETLAEASDLRIERIVSRGHASPADFWYDQDEHEWVLVLQGQAKLRLEGSEEPIDMQPGDYIHIPARQRHRVEWTTPAQATIWLAVFYKDR